MKYSAYPNHKSSGIEWLGDVPEHWEVKQTNFAFAIQLGKMLQPEPASNTEDEVPYLKAQHVQWEKIRVSDLPTMWASATEQAKYSIADGDLLVCEGGDVGRAGIVRNAPERAIIQNALHRVRPKHSNDVRFLMYVLEQAASQKWFDILCNRSTIAHFTGEKFGALRVALPRVAEQRSIADFLDAETAKLDTLIAKKQELIEKLKEKRTALISRTVTRGLPPEAARAAGLNSNLRLKPSGIEWLGDVPEHWKVERLKFLLAEALKYGANESAEIDDPELPRYVRITDIDEGGALREETFRSLPREVAAPYLLRDGDILFARSGATSGKTFLYKKSWGVCAYAGYLIRARLNLAKAVPAFVRYFTASTNYWQWLSSVYIQATIQNVSAEKYGDLWLPVPPPEDQRAIVDYLDQETGKIDRMVEKVEEAIERLQEYRTALITAAVTGKIDVRRSAA